MRLLIAVLLAAGVLSPQSIVILKKKSGCTASYANEALTTQNATAPTGITEANATTGWTDTGLASLISDTTAPHLGTYHIAATANSNADRLTAALSLTDSQLYRLSLWVRHNGTGGDWRCGLGSSGTVANSVLFSVLATETTYTNRTALFRWNSETDTLLCSENSGTDNGGIYLDAVSVAEATPCLGSDLHTNANAASMTTEANATTGFSAINSLNSLTSDATSADGSYAIKADATTSPVNDNGVAVDLSAAPFSAQVGTKYMVMFKARHIGAGDSWRCGLGSDTSGVSTVVPYAVLASSNGTYQGFAWEITYSASTRYFKCTEIGATSNGGVYLDSFVVQEIASQ